jgi:predicted dehydrogenase
MDDSGARRVGLVGAGVISHNHLPHWLRLGAQVAVYAEAGAPELTAAHGGTVVASLDELLDWADLVDIASPTPTHYPIARAALAAGKDVISEKPLARTAEQATELIELARAAGRQIYPAHVVRYFPAYAQLRQVVADGLLGQLAVLRFYRWGGFPTRSAWFADLDASGGVILDMMVHDLDIARWVAGEVTRVSATRLRRDGPAEAAHVLLTHASGAISQVSGLWGPPTVRFATGFAAAGTGGTLEHDSAADRAYVTSTERRGQLVPDTDPTEDPYYLVLADLLAALATGGQPRTTAADGAAAIRIACAALESAQTGQPVEVA